jgi:hypothetical protein
MYLTYQPGDSVINIFPAKFSVINRGLVVPAISQNCANYIITLFDLVSYIINLIKSALLIISLAGIQKMVANL